MGLYAGPAGPISPEERERIRRMQRELAELAEARAHRTTDDVIDGECVDVTEQRRLEGPKP